VPVLLKSPAEGLSQKSPYPLLETTIGMKIFPFELARCTDEFFRLDVLLGCCPRPKRASSEVEVNAVAILKVLVPWTVAAVVDLLDSPTSAVSLRSV